MDTPNNTFSSRVRIQQAKDWLKENPKEKIVTAARIFKIPRTTLSFSIHHANNRSVGGLNRILAPGQEKSVNMFIRSHLEHNILPTKGVIMSAVTHLRTLEGKPRPSNRWFQSWWKTQELHKIRTKPIARERVTAQDKVVVQDWFKKYRDIVQKHNITRNNIWNFDETGFRIGCPKGQDIYVPLPVREVGY
jgi:hypothetical protein